MATYNGIFTGGGTSGTGDRSATGTPAVGDLLVVFCDVRVNTNSAPTCSDDQGGTYTLIDTAFWGTSAHIGSCFVRDSLVSSAVSHTVTVATGSNVSGNVAVVRVASMTKTGATAVLHKGKQENQSAGTPAPALNAACDTANVTIGAVNSNDNPANLTAPTSWTERADIGQATSPVGLHIVTRDSGFTGTTVTWGSATATVFSSMIIELDGSSSGGSAYDQGVAHIASAAAVRGLGSPLSAGVQGLGRIASAAVTRGLDHFWAYYQDFETATVAQVFPALQGSTASIATDQFKFGTHALKITETGSASGSTRNLPTGTRQIAVRFWFRLSATPSATQAIFNFNIGGASGLVVRVSTSGAIQVGFNLGTFQSGGTVALNAWHSVDLNIDVSTGSFTCDWKFDDVAKTQATLASTAADLSWKVANAGANTLNLWIDAVQLVGDPTQYPLNDDIFSGGGPAAYTITLGRIASVAALRGLASPLTGGVQGVQHLAHTPTLRGVSQPLTADYGIGRVASGATLRGLDSIKTLLLAIGFINTPSTAVGVCSLGQTNQSLGTTTVVDVESKLGRRFTGLRQNQSILNTGISTAESQYDLGYTRSYRNVETNDPGDWALTASGGFDTELTTLANAILASGRWTRDNPFYLAYHHEQTVDNGTQCGYPTNGTQQDYINGARAFRLLLDALGATTTDINGNENGGCIETVFCPWAKMFHSTAPAGQAADDFDWNQGTSPAPAGVNYFHKVGLDYYNPVISAGTLKYTTDPATILDNVVAMCEAYGVDFIIPEIGCDLSGFSDQPSIDAKAEWVSNLKDYLIARGETGPGVCRGLWLTFSDSGGDYRVDDTPESLVAYRDLANDDYFGGGPEARGATFGPLTGNQDIAHLTSGATARGVHGQVAADYGIGRIASGATVRGLLAPLSLIISLAHIGSSKALHGFQLPATATYAIGRVTHSPTLRGIATPLAATVPLGRVTHSPTLHGLDSFVANHLPTLQIPVADFDGPLPTLSHSATVPCYNVTVTLPVYDLGPRTLPTYRRNHRVAAS